MWLVFIGLVLACLPSWAPRLGLSPGVQGPPAAIVWNLTAVVLLLGFVLGVERRRLNSIRLVRPSGKDLEWALILFGCHMGWTWLARTLWPPPPNTGIQTITALPVPVVLALIVSAAVCEEILHRGYPLERLTELTGRRWVAVVVTLPVVVLPHLVFFGAEWLLYHGSGTLMLYALFLWRRNLVACMVLHLAVNMPVLIPVLAGRGG